MSDYSQYSYRDLLQYIDEYRQQNNKERNYVKYLLSMEHATTLEELITIFNNIFKLLVNISFGNKRVPYNWYLYECWSVRDATLVEQLRDCLNENILNWIKNQNNPTTESYLHCIINLRESPNRVHIQQEIVNLCEEDVGNEVRTYDYFKRFQYEFRIDLDKPSKSPMRNTLQKQFEKYSIELAEKGYIFDVVEITFGKKHGIDYDTILTQYKEQKQLEETRKAENEKLAKIEKRKGIIRFVIYLTLLLIVFGGLMYLLEQIGGILGLIIIIGLIGSIPKIIMKGKL